MANCCVNGLNQVFCNAFNKYYNTLYTNGEISKEETNNLLIIDYIRLCLSDDRYNGYYNILLKALRCIANNSCLLDTSWLYNRSIIPKVTNLFVTVLTKLPFTETDPIFSASPAATITDEDIDNWNNSIGGGEQSDWDETDTDSLAYIKNKPTIPAAQVQSNWNESNTSSKAYIQNKPTIPSIPTTATQAEVDAGSSTSQRTFTPQLFHDNAYIVEESYSSGSLKANKMYDFGTVSTALTIPSLDATNDLVSNALNFYALRFIAGTDNLSITFPTGVEVDDTPTINTGDYVEIMINLYVSGGTNKFYASIKVWQAQ